MWKIYHSSGGTLKSPIAYKKDLKLYKLTDFGKGIVESLRK